MDYPVIAEKNGIKIKPEYMEKEKLYHCIFDDKVLLVYKDYQDFLNCYEIEEEDLVERIKKCDNEDDLEKLFDTYLKDQNLKN